MLKKLKKTAFEIFYTLIAVYSTVLFVGGMTNIIYAQEIRDYRLENMEKRVADLEALKFDQRVTRIETMLIALEKNQNPDWLNYAGNGGVGLLLARALYLDIRKRRGIE